MSIRASVLSLLVIVAGISSAAAQCDNTPGYVAPDAELFGAGFGNAVVISADGTIALVAGSGFDLGDGIVRSFEKINGVWAEGLAFRSDAFVGENFGYAIAMNDAGDLAAISAPFHWNTDPFVLAAGVVDIWERDAGAGGSGGTGGRGSGRGRTAYGIPTPASGTTSALRSP